jgi:hypothetical protein
MRQKMMLKRTKLKEVGVPASSIDMYNNDVGKK